MLINSESLRGIAKYMVAMRQVVLYRDEDDYWVVECPSLKGCVSQGKTKEEALANIKEAIAGYVAALEEDGILVPTENFEAFLVVV
jgi:predicted RNase H-like HicB family nuclease